MEEQHFDDLARLVATKTSRRQVLKVLAGAALGGMFANRLSPALAANVRSSCAQFCNQTFGPDTDATSQCLKDAKRNPNALCNSACNSGGESLCGPTSGAYYTSYSSTTCCPSGQTCGSINGAYTCAAACGSIGQSCCATGTCTTGYCDATSFTCVACVPSGDQVYDSTACCSGLVYDLSANTCVTCVPGGHHAISASECCPGTVPGQVGPYDYLCFPPPF